MKKWQKFSVIFFLGAMSTFFAPTVSAYSDFGDGETPPTGNINEPPVKLDEKPKDKNPGENKIQIENKEPAPEPPPAKITENPAPPPADNSNIRNENFNDDDNKFESPVDTGVLGDVNNDGVLNAVDLVILQKYLKGDVFEINENASDINGDGIISKFDVFALLNLIKAEKKGTGDVNNDGKVDIYDVQALTAYLANPAANINIVNADLSGDGRISTDDLKILKNVISALQ